jgi:hypothetical protein
MRQLPEYKDDKTDKFYQWKGVKAPSRTAHGVSEDDVEELLAGNIATHQCQYTQRGNEISCEIGGFTHGKRIRPNQRLSPLYESGTPILCDITFS